MLLAELEGDTASLDEGDKKVDDAANELVLPPPVVDVPYSTVVDTLKLLAELEGNTFPLDDAGNKVDHDGRELVISPAAVEVPVWLLVGIVNVANQHLVS